ncbi:hypothetical protein [Streptomyces sp. NPDC001914]|uniref:hypothetical protein n=1 Tax=Streptomyces sp. NPDC001914 TaxID=3364623 RepID=UPI00368AA172
MSNNPRQDRDPRQDRLIVALALMGTALFTLVALLYPAAIPALTIAITAFMAIAFFLGM